MEPIRLDGVIHHKNDITLQPCGGTFWELSHRPYVTDQWKKNHLRLGDFQRPYYVCERCRVGYDDLVTVRV